MDRRCRKTKLGVTEKKNWPKKEISAGGQLCDIETKKGNKKVAAGLAFFRVCSLSKEWVLVRSHPVKLQVPCSMPKKCPLSLSKARPYGSVLYIVPLFKLCLPMAKEVSKAVDKVIF